MFKKAIYKPILAIFLLLGVSVHLQAQNHPLPAVQRIEAQIDSVARTLNISIASICMNEIGNRHDKTATGINCLVSRKEFTISNGFLQINNTYFNLEKLLYFKIEEDRRTKQPFLEFYFQFY